jgi:hypothetical protein
MNFAARANSMPVSGSDWRLFNHIFPDIGYQMVLGGPSSGVFSSGLGAI